MQFHQTLDEFNETISRSEDKKHAIFTAKEQIEKSLIDLHKAHDESIRDIVLSNLKTYINLGDSPALSAVFPMIGLATSGRLEISQELGALLGFSVNVAINLAIKSTSKVDILKDEFRPYAYLYHVDKLNK